MGLFGSFTRVSSLKAKSHIHNKIIFFLRRQILQMFSNIFLQILCQKWRKEEKWAFEIEHYRISTYYSLAIRLYQNSGCCSRDDGKILPPNIKKPPFVNIEMWGDKSEPRAYDGDHKILQVLSWIFKLEAFDSTHGSYFLCGWDIKNQTLNNNIIANFR